MSLKFLIKILLIKRNFALLSEALGKKCSPMFPKRGPYVNRCPDVVPYVNTLGTRCG